MPAQDRVRGDQTLATLRSGQPPDEGGERVPVGPLQRRSWVGAAQHGDLVPQHRSSMSLVEDVRLNSRSSPSTCRKIKYSRQRIHSSDHA